MNRLCEPPLLVRLSLIIPLFLDATNVLDYPALPVIAASPIRTKRQEVRLYSWDTACFDGPLGRLTSLHSINIEWQASKRAGNGTIDASVNSPAVVATAMNGVSMVTISSPLLHAAPPG